MPRPCPVVKRCRAPETRKKREIWRLCTTGQLRVLHGWAQPPRLSSRLYAERELHVGRSGMPRQTYSVGAQKSESTYRHGYLQASAIAVKRWCVECVEQCNWIQNPEHFGSLSNS